MTTARVRLNDSVRVRLGAERGFLFDERTGRVYSLNASAAVAAAGLRDRQPSADVVAAVVDAFDVDAETAQRDFARFVSHLVEEGLARVDDEQVQHG
jgi:hypothetical protein